MTHAQFTFGDLYERGDWCRSRWRRPTAGTSARRRAVQAQVALATNYFTGRGVPLDYGRAFHWYSKAAAAGDGGAQYIVGSYYERGYPGVVDKDIEQAKIWYARAAAHGDPGALAKLRSLLEDRTRAKGQM
jgi:TPR repeat protein